jgi:hypothetical protein
VDLSRATLFLKVSIKPDGLSVTARIETCVYSHIELRCQSMEGAMP